MSGVNEIEEAVLRLTAAKLDAAAWDRRMEGDVAAGRLDTLADEAVEDLRTGRCTEQ